MRRRWLWILSSLAVLAVAALLILGFAPPPPPYGFLEGLEAGAPPEYEIDVEHGIRKKQASSSYYCFKGDYTSVVRKARAELIEEGFQEAGGPAAEAFFQRSDPEVVPARVQNVVIRRGRYAPGPLHDGKEVLLGNDAAGWVTVFVYGQADPGPLERLASWLGP